MPIDAAKALAAEPRSGEITWDRKDCQLYHLATDNRSPYWIYAGQQDNGTVAIASRTDYGAITSRDWHPVGGDERDYDVPDPRDPDIVYCSGLGGRLSRWNARVEANTRYVGERRTVAGSSLNMLEPYWLSDVSLSHPFARRAWRMAEPT